MRVLKKRLETLMDQLGPFAFRKLDLLYFPKCCMFNIPLLRNCPRLQDVGITFLNMDKNEARDILAACSTLRGLDLRAARFEISAPSIVERFSQFQMLHIPSVCMSNLDQIMESLTSSSLQMLEVLGLHPSVPTKHMILAWTTFPNLKEIHFTRVRMYL
ncbi:hypothetical protein BG006_010680 [Podila minutissima]|uniref:Uncharacterized protein n=1 Tax=Podila minutissima TaxID=64525 RepID=A0A9P5SDF5_9FUNG|nr:hypothetical protein BG006_010680 [Podila minutissima]